MDVLQERRVLGGWRGSERVRQPLGGGGALRLSECAGWYFREYAPFEEGMRGGGGVA